MKFEKHHIELIKKSAAKRLPQKERDVAKLLASLDIKENKLEIITEILYREAIIQSVFVDVLLELMSDKQAKVNTQIVSKLMEESLVILNDWMEKVMEEVKKQQEKKDETNEGEGNEINE